MREIMEAHAKLTASTRELNEACDRTIANVENFRKDAERVKAEVVMLPPQSPKRRGSSAKVADTSRFKNMPRTCGSGAGRRARNRTSGRLNL